MIEVRRRLSEGVNRARLKLEVSRAARPMVVLVVGAVLALVGAGYIAGNVSKTVLSSTREVRFAVDDATAVVPGVDLVKFKGIPAGNITKVEMEGSKPVLTAKIQRRFGAIYRDARAVLRPNTALQDMYLDIVDRGTPAAGKAGGAPIAAAQTDIPVDVSDVLGVFRADERARLATLLDQLGRGLEDRGARLRTALAQLTPFLQLAKRISDQLARRRPLTQRLVHNAGLLMAELRSRDEALRRLVRGGSEALGTLQEGSSDLDATLRQLPPTLSAVDSSLTAVRSVLGDVDRAVRSLYPVADRLPGALGSLRDLSSSASPAVRALRPPVERLVPLARYLLPVAGSLRNVVSTLLPQADTIDLVTKRVAGCKQGIQGFFQWDASMSKFGDTRGPVPRGNLSTGPNAVGILHGPDESFLEACTPGTALGGRPARPSDEH